MRVHPLGVSHELRAVTNGVAQSHSCRPNRRVSGAREEIDVAPDLDDLPDGANEVANGAPDVTVLTDLFYRPLR